MMLLLKLLSPSAYGPNVATAAADAISARLKPSLCLLLSFSHSVISESLQPHGLQHDKLPWPSLSPGVCANSSIESVMPSNHLILCCPLFLLLSVFPSIRVFSKESALCIGCLKFWSFSFSISPSNEYSGLLSFRIDLFKLLTVPGTLKHLV